MGHRVHADQHFFQQVEPVTQGQALAVISLASIASLTPLPALAKARFLRRILLSDDGRPARYTRPMDVKRIAMWSGPRNISTAMMRSFGSRSDTTVVDEPLYARYLNANPDQHHPARNEIIAKGPLNLDEITPSLTGQLPPGTTISYQKHMAHHLLPTDFDTPNRPGRLDWIDALHNCLLIRDPADMITSFIKVIPNPAPTDLGLPQQVRLFNHLRDHLGNTPLVLDAKDVLCNPRGMLETLCNHVGIAFDQAMLSWTPGPRPTDGLWAPHWYKNVYKSTRFTPYHEKNEPVPPQLTTVLDQCQSLYNTLHQHRLQPQ